MAQSIQHVSPPCRAGILLPPACGNSGISILLTAGWWCFLSSLVVMSWARTAWYSVQHSRCCPENFLVLLCTAVICLILCPADLNCLSSSRSRTSPWAPHGLWHGPESASRQCIGTKFFLSLLSRTTVFHYLLLIVWRVIWYIFQPDA